MYRGETIRTVYLSKHILRSMSGVISAWLWFYAIGELPLATAMTLNYMSPIWMAVILFVGGLWLGKKGFDWGLVAAVITSFIGVALLLRPSINTEQWLGGISAIMSGILAALVYLQVRNLGRLGEPDSRSVFYFSLSGMIVGFMGSLYDGIIAGGNMPSWTGHSGTGILLLLTIGVSGSLAQIAMTRAYRLGKTLVTANLQYTGIIFSSGWGILIWGDKLSWLSWAGISIILFSGLAATYYNIRNMKSSEETTQARDTDPIATEL
jgi:S-adenosylmethionine uptake transporter